VYTYMCMCERERHLCHFVYTQQDLVKGIRVHRWWWLVVVGCCDPRLCCVLCCSRNRSKERSTGSVSLAESCCSCLIISHLSFASVYHHVIIPAGQRDYHGRCHGRRRPLLVYFPCRQVMRIRVPVRLRIRRLRKIRVVRIRIFSQLLRLVAWADS
jgi:hypothetical protein